MPGKRNPDNAAEKAGKRKAVPSASSQADAIDVSGPADANDQVSIELAKLSSVNAPLWAASQRKIDAMKCHPIMENITTAPPPAVTDDASAESGIQAAFNAQDFAVAMG